MLIKTLKKIFENPKQVAAMPRAKRLKTDGTSTIKKPEIVLDKKSSFLVIGKLSVKSEEFLLNINEKLSKFIPTTETPEIIEAKKEKFSHHSLK